MLLSIGFWWNDGTGTTFVQLNPQPVGIEGLVGQKGIEINTLNQRFDTDHVVALTGQQHEADQISKGIYKGDDFAAQTAARAPDSLILSPPFAPLAFW